MKFRKISFPVLVAGILLVGQSCNKIEDFKNLNSNPNNTTSPNTAALLTNSLAGIGSNLVWDQGGISTVAGLYAQYFSETQYTEASRYATQTFNFDGYYTGVLYDLQNIINYNSDPATAGIAADNGSNANQIAIARILKAYYFYFVTCAYGDIPYSESLKGGSGANAYDDQQAIFVDLLKELTEAVAQFDNGTTVKGDILYAGNVARWKKFGNSIKALIGLQMAKKDPNAGKAAFTAALAAGVITDNADNATLKYPGGNYNTPAYNYYNVTQRDDYAVSKTVTDMLNATNDPRVTKFGTSNIGFPYGYTRDNAVAFANGNGNFARLLGGTGTAGNGSVVIIGAGNMTLARAEAAQRGWTSETVATLYATGIQQSWEQWGVYNATSFATYIALSSIALTAGTEMQKIATAEWLAFYPAGWQGFNIWRRTGFPVLTPAPGTTTGIPRRFPYGPNENNLNTANATAAGATYTVGGVPNSPWGKVWFDN